MHIAGFHPDPEHGGQVAHRVGGVRVLHELGLGGGARGEVEQQGLVGPGRRVRGEVLAPRPAESAYCRAALLVAALPRRRVADFDQRVVARDLGELADIGASDGGPVRAAALHPVLQVRRPHQRGGGDHDDAQLDAGEHQFPEFHLVAEHDDHAVTAPHTLAAQPVGHLGGAPGQVREAAPRGGAVLLDDDEGRVVRLGRVRRDLVEPVQREVEVLKARPLEFAARRLVVRAEVKHAVACCAEVLSDCHGAPFEVWWRSRFRPGAVARGSPVA